MRSYSVLDAAEMKFNGEGWERIGSNFKAPEKTSKQEGWEFREIEDVKRETKSRIVRELEKWIDFNDQIEVAELIAEFTLPVQAIVPAFAWNTALNFVRQVLSFYINGNFYKRISIV